MMIYYDVVRLFVSFLGERGLMKMLGRNMNKHISFGHQEAVATDAPVMRTQQGLRVPALVQRLNMFELLDNLKILL